MKLEVGQFVRTKDKRNITYIRKIREIPQDNRYASIYLDKEANYSKGLSLKNIIKASYNIIDILEAGDIIRYRIDKVSLETKGYLTGVIDIVDEEMIESIKEDKNYHVLQVLTKEQFEEMSYKIKESR
jgi:hypothetical protein